ncbi:DUF4214 domain-containing protein [Undibacterium sp. JH2W]|uniref:DUF4214 domain-containing protein n=1 Tax=Undibacterium sp. JH2W TaxID=3413037 RepID=UPI003BF22CAA
MGANASVIQKIYIAYFNRPADVAGLQYWEGQLDANKISLAGLAQSFSEQVEYQNTYGGKNTVTVVTALYQNLFGRAPDSGGLSYWTGQIDSAAINLGQAALAILNGASPLSDDGIAIANKLNFAERFTASLDTPAKAANYTSSLGLEAVKLVMSKVLAGAPVPTLTSHANLNFPSGHNTVNGTEAANGLKIDLDLKDLAVSVGYKLELMINGEPFTSRVVHTITMAEILAQKASIAVPGATFWGVDGGKSIGVKVSDIFGNTGDLGAETRIQLDTIAPAAGTSYTTRYNYANSTTHLELNIPQGELTGGHITLGSTETNTLARVDIISATDTKVAFDLNEAQNKSMYYGGYNVREYDSAGNVTTFNILNLPNAFLTGSDTKLTNPKNTSFIPVDGKGVLNTINASNSKLIVTADIVAGEATGGYASLSMNGFSVFDREILAGDTKLRFEINTDSAYALKALLGKGATASIELHTAAGSSAYSVGWSVLETRYLDGEAIQGGLTAPTGLIITPLGGKVSNSSPGTVVLNGSNVAISAEVSIVAGQATSGYAELWIGNQRIASNHNISITDTKLTFNIISAPLEAYDPQHLQYNVPKGGVAVVKLFDYAGHEVDSAGNLTVITNYSSLTGYDVATHPPPAEPVQIVGIQQDLVS